jgi:acyl-CoA dehydrogenase
MPFSEMILEAYQLGLADGPTEVHKVALARDVLSNHSATDGLFPTSHLPGLREAAAQKYASALADLV